MFKNLKIAIIDEQHLTAVCEVLESMGYHPYQPSKRLQFIYTQTDGLYSFGDDCVSSISYETVTLRDLLQMRDEMVKEKINGLN